MQLSGYLHLWKSSNKKSGVYIRFIPLTKMQFNENYYFNPPTWKGMNNLHSVLESCLARKKNTWVLTHLPFPSPLVLKVTVLVFCSRVAIWMSCRIQAWLFFATICVLKSGISQSMAIVVGTRMIHWYTIKFLGKAIFRQTHNFQESSGCS